MYPNLKIALLSLLFLTFSGLSIAQEENHDHHEEKHPHFNHLALNVGAITQYNVEGNYLSIGIDYIRQFKRNENWGVSFIIEGIDGEHFQWVFGCPIMYKPVKNLWLRTGPGIELVKKENLGIVEVKAEFLMRFGLD